METTTTGAEPLILVRDGDVFDPRVIINEWMTVFARIEDACADAAAEAVRNGSSAEEAASAVRATVLKVIAALPIMGV